MRLLLLFITIIYALPTIDNSWIGSCPGCVCTPQTQQNCLCYKNCPNVTDYFYIVNVDPFNTLQGRISHSVQLNRTWIVQITSSYPTYQKATFRFCRKDPIITCVSSDTQFIGLVVQENTTEIFFWYKIKPKDFSIWVIYDMIWIPV